MWVAKVSFSSKGTLIGTQAAKHKVNIFAFPLSYSEEKGWMAVQFAGTIFGEEEDKRRLVAELKKNQRVVSLEANKDFLIGVIKEPLYTRCVYNKDIIHVTPALIPEHGDEVINIGSFNREKLVKAAKILEEKHGGKLISIQNKKLNSISIMSVRPDLTDKQRRAMELAIKHGYYHSPRKIDVQTLAKMAKLSFATYQVHLRKAEEKLIPYFFE